jgi:PAS domain S-box-containing protein
VKDNPYRILLIEDDRLDQMAFMRFVEGENLPYDCTIAGSVSEARTLLGSERFDVVIADYSLGDGTAFDLLDAARRVPVILVTGAGDEEVAVRAWRAGAYDYLIKDLEGNYLKTLPITLENAVTHKKIKERAQLLSGAVMNTDDSVFITDTQGRIIFVNRAFCETYGYSEEEVIGRNTDILFREGPLGHDSQNLYRSFEGIGSSSLHRRKDGSEFPVSLSISPIRDETGEETARVGVARDISEQVLAVDKIKTINLKLKGGNRFTS